MKQPCSLPWRALCRPFQISAACWLLVVLVACGPAASVPATPSPIPSATPAATASPATDTADPPAPTETAPPPAPTDTPSPPAATPTLPDLPATLPATAVPTDTPPVPTATPRPPTATEPPPATDTPLPPATATARPPAATHTPPPPTATLRPAAATRTPTPKAASTRTQTVKPVATQTPPPAPTQAPVAALPTASTATGHVYDAYIPAATKQHQDYHYSCEFDAAWVVLKTYGIDSTIDQMISIIGTDTSHEPTWEETPKGVFIYGGDVLHYYSGDFKTNFLARTTGSAMRKIFAHFGLTATPVHDQKGIEAALRAGSLVWIKTTADFKPGRPATWVMPDGTTYQTVLGNDHAAVVIGYNKDVAVIRDVLGPTSTNAQRQYEYEVPWPHFLQIWAEQSNDGLAIAPPK